MLKGLIEGVENFSAEKLKSVKTREPASGKDGEQRILMSVSWCIGVNYNIRSPLRVTRGLLSMIRAHGTSISPRETLRER